MYLEDYLEHSFIVIHKPEDFCLESARCLYLLYQSYENEKNQYNYFYEILEGDINKLEYECEKIFRQWCMLRKKVTKSYLKID